MSTPAVSAIVVNYRRPDMLAACLASLVEALARVPEGTELVVLDNASGDESCDIVRRVAPDARLIELPPTRGLAGAGGEAIRHSSGEWLLLINNDVEVDPEAVRYMLVGGRSAAEVGSVAAQMRFASNGAGTINSAGIGVDRRAMLDEIGGLDPSFFFCLDDADVAWRARMRGWRCLYVPRAVVKHHHGATGAHGSDLKYFHVGLNRVRMLAKNADARQLRRYGLAIASYDLAYVAYAA